MLQAKLTPLFERFAFDTQLYENLPFSYLLLMFVLAGFSQAVGHSGILFIKKVKPTQFLLSLVSATLFYLARMSLWLGLIWLIMLFFQPTPIKLILTVLALSRFFQVFAFLEFLPVIGITQARLITLLGLAAASFGLAYFSNTALSLAAFVILIAWLSENVLVRFSSSQLLALHQRLFGKSRALSLVNEELNVNDALSDILIRENPIT